MRAQPVPPTIDELGITGVRYGNFDINFGTIFDGFLSLYAPYAVLYLVPMLFGSC